ncbi:MAG: hypothetical protein JWO92_1054 [Chitinophagaceae bacterium]|nr:hypothetical protein [Chitinophagaceae bacterium]
MITPKSILVTTTSSIEDIKVKQYIKPVTAHIVAGTGLVSDFLGSFSDVFGGRSHAYQKQLTSLYNEAIERLKHAAYELGANCIIGLKIDLDEISGKGKSMFMITAIGTACVVDNTEKKVSGINVGEKFENVGLDRLKTLNNKRIIVEKAESGNLALNDEVWNFVTSNQIHEVYPYLLRKFQEQINMANFQPEAYKDFYKYLLSYMEVMPEPVRSDLLYSSIMMENNDDLALRLCDIIKDLNLLDLNKAVNLLETTEFQKQKRGLRILIYDKEFYNKEDVKTLDSLKSFIVQTFPERGIKGMKKQLLSSKEKEVWTCECGKVNFIEDVYCKSCQKDIYGFKEIEVSPSRAIQNIDNKISLIKVYVV